MITLPRSAVRTFQTMVRRALLPHRARDSDYPVRFQTTEHGLIVSAYLEEVVLAYRLPGNSLSLTLVLPFRELSGIEGKSSAVVTLRSLGGGKGEATWEEDGVSKTVPLELMRPDRVPSLPELPTKVARLDPSSLAALGETVKTTGQPPARTAMTRLLLRGSAGEVVGTDGRQMLIQSGLDLPWKEDVLVPSCPALAHVGVEGDAAAAMIGRTKHHVSLRAGPWTFFLKIDPSSRYPDYEAVIPPANRTPTHLHLDSEDRHFLREALKGLGKLRGESAVVLNLGKEISVRFQGEEDDSTTEAVLSRSRHAGPPARMATDPTYLLRAASLGFSHLRFAAEGPIVCQDQCRTYVWMPLVNGCDRQPTGEVRRLVSGLAPTPEPAPTRRTEVMPARQNGIGRPHEDAIETARNGEETPYDLVAEAEAVRTMLHDAIVRVGHLMGALRQQKRQTRAVSAAMKSLRQIQFDR